jgi:hypothetical protein
VLRRRLGGKPARSLATGSAGAPPRARTTCVVFTVPEGRLSEMDVATGPCVPRDGRKRSLVSVHSQEGPETPEQTAALFRALTGRSADDVLHLIEHGARGRLYRCSEAFIDAMADANQQLVELAAEDKARKDRELTTFSAKRKELDDRWIAAAEWPASMKSTRNRLVRLGLARAAREKEQALYCWYGPSVPEYAVVAGRGPYR